LIFGAFFTIKCETFVFETELFGVRFAVTRQPKRR